MFGAETGHGTSYLSIAEVQLHISADSEVQRVHTQFFADEVGVDRELRHAAAMKNKIVIFITMRDFIAQPIQFGFHREIEDVQIRVTEKIERAVKGHNGQAEDDEPNDKF
jgi:hypothetical protein